jgi:hypothetical protein
MNTPSDNDTRHACDTCATVLPAELNARTRHGNYAEGTRHARTHLFFCRQSTVVSKNDDHPTASVIAPRGSRVVDKRRSLVKNHHQRCASRHCRLCCSNCRAHRLRERVFCNCESREALPRALLRLCHLARCHVHVAVVLGVLALKALPFSLPLALGFGELARVAVGSRRREKSEKQRSVFTLGRTKVFCSASIDSDGAWLVQTVAIIERHAVARVVPHAERHAEGCSDAVMMLCVGVRVGE